jgi:hypothetical protein
MDNHFIDQKLQQMEDDTIDKETDLEVLEGRILMMQISTQ